MTVLDHRPSKSVLPALQVQGHLAWRADGDKLIVCMDVNENIYSKSISKLLTDTSDLAMVEVVGDFTRQPLPATYFRGSKPIDAIWATPDVKVTGACVMPSGYGIGDHRLFVVDFSLSSIVGHMMVPI